MGRSLTPPPLLKAVQDAGIPCRRLRGWLYCHDGHADYCGKCFMDGPETCDADLVTNLVELLVRQAGDTDQVLGQRDYWKRVADRLTDVVMGRRLLFEEDA